MTAKPDPNAETNSEESPTNLADEAAAGTDFEAAEAVETPSIPAPADESTIVECGRDNGSESPTDEEFKTMADVEENEPTNEEVAESDEAAAESLEDSSSESPVDSQVSDAEKQMGDNSP